MLMYFVKEVLICILLSSIIIGAGHYAVYIFEHNKNINYPVKNIQDDSNILKLNILKEEENNISQDENVKEETKSVTPSKNKNKLKESLERLKKLT